MNRRRRDELRKRRTPGEPGGRDSARSRGRRTSRRPIRAGLRRRPRFQVRGARAAAQSRLRKFRQASALAVSLTAMLLLVWGVPPSSGQEAAAPETQPADSVPAADPMTEPAPTAEDDPSLEQETGSEPSTSLETEASLEEATTTVRDLLRGFLALLPKIAIALALLLLAFLLSGVVRTVLRHASHRWEMIDAVSAMVRIGLVLLAIGAGLSVIAGDARALVGSVGLVGLALSWALQTPIESFTGWVLNAFHSYYRPGDRIEVGDVHGDVYRIDVLTTTVWEVGGPGKSVAAAQSTGALITFPNWEVLRSNIINYSRAFPYVWDEITVGITNESDLRYAVDVLRSVAEQTVGEMMQEPVDRYRKVLERERLAFDIEREPQIYVSAADAWTNCTIRYLVPIRERRKWSSLLLLAITEELANPEHASKIRGSYPRMVVDVNERPH